MSVLTMKDGKTLLDGKPFRMISGAMHYFRVLPEQWKDMAIGKDELEQE